MILEHIKRNLPNNNRLIVAGVSGGPDSLCLVDGLARLGYPVVVAHFNHLLRPEAGDEARRVEEVAISRGVDFLLGEGDVRQHAHTHALSLEEAARLLRYQFLFEQARNLQAGAVVVGHNANDQVETMLMNLLRGSGLAGLSGMLPSTLPNPWSETIPLVRPLLGVWREDILAYCRERNLKPVHDPSNVDTAFFRNRLRRELLPLLEEYRPGVQQRLWQTAHILAGDQEALQQHVDHLWRAFPTQCTGDYVAFDSEEFLSLPKGTQRRLIRRTFRHLRPDFTEISFEVVETACQFMARPSQSKEANLAGRVRIMLIGKRVYLAAWEANIPLDAWPQMGKDVSQLVLQAPGQVDLPAGWSFHAEYVKSISALNAQKLQRENPFQVYLDAGKTRPLLLIRSRQKGERFAPLGMDGHSMKIADFMVNEKIPRHARPKWPLVISQGEVIWVPGHRLAHAVRVTDETEKVLSLTLDQG
ncbi:MAG: tRNA(Ile)-lysidine synthase [Chloroflexi bacterium]|nr:tRNA(Ile)-lysidine synthase [Chloroflexota bacterium]